MIIGTRCLERGSSAPWWLGYWYRKSVIFNVCLFQSVNRHGVLFISHLYGEKLVISLDDSIGTGEGSLERRLPGVCAYEDVLGVEQTVRDIGLGRAMCDGRDRLEVSNLLTKLP